MVFRSTAILFATVPTLGLASAGTTTSSITPELNVALSRSGKSDFSGNLSPSVRWKTEGNVGGTDYEGGFNLAASGLSDSDLPFSVWGKLRREVGDWSISAKIDASSDNLAILNIDLLAKGGPTDLTLDVQGSLDTGRQRGELRQVGFSQSIEAPGGDLSLTPRFNLASGKADVTVEYAHDDTRIKIDAGTDRQRITVAQRIDDANSISPSITSDGDLQLGYRRVIGDGAVTAIYKPNDRICLRYEEGPWVATVDIPMDGYFELNSGDAMVNIRRSVKMEAI